MREFNIQGIRIEVLFVGVDNGAKGMRRMYYVTLNGKANITFFDEDSHYNKDNYRDELIWDIVKHICKLYKNNKYNNQTIKEVVTKDWVDSIMLLDKMSE
jgi:hypothetical protein